MENGGHDDIVLSDDNDCDGDSDGDAAADNASINDSMLCTMPSILWASSHLVPENTM